MSWEDEEETVADMSREDAEQNLSGANALTDEVRAAVERFLTTQIGNPNLCSSDFFGPVAEGYPDRAEVVAAVNLLWRGLHELYRLDPHADRVEWCAGFPFVSDGDGQWLIGGTVYPGDEYL